MAIFDRSRRGRSIRVLAEAIEQRILLSVSIPIIDPGFNTVFEPGSTSVTGTLPPGAFVSGFGSNVQASTTVQFSDGTSGTTVDIPGWDSTNAPNSGVEANQPVNYPSFTGANWAFVNGPLFGGADSETITQALAGVLLQPNTTYTLSADVGLRADSDTLVTPIIVGLDAGNVQLIPDSSSSPTPAAGTFSTFTRTFTTTGTVPNGGGLTVVLGYGPGANADGKQIDFTNVKLTASFEIAFAPHEDLTTAQGPFAVAVADINGDGIPDILTTTNYGQTSTGNGVAVLLGNGDGTFRSFQTFTTGTHDIALAVVDLNHDGHPDIVTANQSDNTISVLLGNGDGTFRAQHTYATGSTPSGLVVSDVNGDGNPDVLVANYSGNSIGVFLGNGDGTFKAQQTVATPVQPKFISVSDLNGDGKPDLIVSAHGGGNTVNVLLGNGDGTFSAPQVVPGLAASNIFTYGITAGDLNGDGRPDLVDVVDIGGAIDLNVVLGNGNGTFGPVETIPTTGSAYSVLISDMNGDGKTDLVAIDRNGAADVFLGNGDGTFEPQETFTLPLGGFLGAVADLNRDGKPDIVAAIRGPGGNFTSTVSVLLNTSDGKPTITQSGPTVTGVGTAFSDTASITSDGTNLTVTIDGFAQSFSLSSINRIAVALGNGDDLLSVGAGVPGVSVAGGAGNDTLVGGSGNDTLNGGKGADVIRGAKGADSLSGGKGDDIIIGGAGKDTSSGGGGEDTIVSGQGTDSLSGGPGNDIFVNAGGAADTVNGGTGINLAQFDPADVLANIFEVYDPPTASAALPVAAQPLDAAGVTASIVAANLKVVGSAASDSIAVGTNGTGDFTITANGAPLAPVPMAGITGIVVVGKTGNDTITVDPSILLQATLRGSAGNDSISAGGGNTVLVGGGGADTLIGGAGNDLLVPGPRVTFAGAPDGNDSIDGGAGLNTVDYSRRTDNLTLRLDGSGASGDLAAGEADTLVNIRNVLGGLGNDTIVGNNSNDFASGGAGDDSITGGSGNDAIVGSAGADTVFAAAGHNTLLLKNDGSSDRYFPNPGGAGLDIDAVDATDVLGTLT
jgi:hypothetical protein